MDARQRQQLLGIKLAALVRDQWGDAPRTPSQFPGGAAVKQEDRHGWVLVEDDPGRALGGALGWARREDIGALDVLVEDADAAGALARRSQFFTRPVGVWVVDGRAVREAEAAVLPPEPSAPEGVETLAAAIEAAGAEVVVEHGDLLGEVLGLEVCRVVDGKLQVGVGKHDREAHLLAYGEQPPLEALPRVVEEVRTFRLEGAPVHPANQLATERWLRALVCMRPSLVGLPDDTRLHKVPSPVARPDLRRPAPAPARGPDVLVVCSTGVDVDLVPAAADGWAMAGRPARLLLAVPEGDDHPLTYDLAAALERPAEVVKVRKDWRSA